MAVEVIVHAYLLVLVVDVHVLLQVLEVHLCPSELWTFPGFAVHVEGQTLLNYYQGFI